MHDVERFRRAAVSWIAGVATRESAAVAREVTALGRVRTVVLVEGDSDAAAVQRLAERRGRDLAAEAVAIVPLGGATSIRRFMDLFVGQSLDVRLAGLCDAAEEGYFRRALEGAGLGHDLTPADMRSLGFHVCVADLEDELIRAHGVESVEAVIEQQGELRAFRTFQRQPAQRERPAELQLRRFLGTHSGSKLKYADALVRDLDLDRTHTPLDDLLASL